MRQVRHETLAHRVGHLSEHDGHGPALLPQRHRHRIRVGRMRRPPRLRHRQEASRCPLFSKSDPNAAPPRIDGMCHYRAFSRWGAVGGVNEMNSALSPVRKRAATPAFDKPSDEQTALIRLDSRQSAAEWRPPDKSKAPLLLLRFLYWIYERRLLEQLKHRPIPHHIGIILDGNRRHCLQAGRERPK
jgi:hypothetical protein